MTQPHHDLLMQQARLRDKVLTFKELAHLTGFSKTYCQQVMDRMSNGVKITVSRETSINYAVFEEIMRRPE